MRNLKRKPQLQRLRNDALVNDQLRLVRVWTKFEISLEWVWNNTNVFVTYAASVSQDLEQISKK